MERRTILLLSVFGILLVGAILLFFVIKPFGKIVEAETSFVCETGIEAGLTQGPDSPLDLSGTLRLTVAPDSSFAGTLTLKKDNSVVKVTGMGTGRGIDMVFDPGNGKLLYAHGSQQYAITECKGFVGGPLVGPRYGDMGDWTNYPPYIRIISGTRAT